VYQIESELFVENTRGVHPSIDGNVLQVCSAADYRELIPAGQRNDLFSLEAGRHRIMTIYSEPGELHADQDLSNPNFQPSQIFFHSNIRVVSLYQGRFFALPVNHLPENHTVDLNGDSDETFLDYQQYFDFLNQFTAPTAVSLFRCAYNPVRSLAQDGWNHYLHLRELGRRINGGLYIADATGDASVDVFDLYTVIGAMGSELLDANGNLNPNFQWKADLNGDQRVDYFDLMTVINQMGSDYASMVLP
jgi:hypothetical protein